MSEFGPSIVALERHLLARLLGNNPATLVCTGTESESTTAKRAQTSLEQYQGGKSTCGNRKSNEADNVAKPRRRFSNHEATKQSP